MSGTPQDNIEVTETTTRGRKTTQPGHSTRHFSIVTMPAVVPDGIYSAVQLAENLGVGHVTISDWVRYNGLPVIQPGTRRHFFLGSEVIEFMITHRAGGISRPEKPAAKGGAQ
jgi:hypothetical protein